MNKSELQIVNDLQSEYYGMVWLGLANAAYESENDKEHIAEDIRFVITNPDYTPLLPTGGQEGKENPDTIPGSWSLDWGPAIDPDNSNCLFIASYRNSDNTPLFYSVVIRGTNTGSGIDGLIAQIKQDIEDFKLHGWKALLDGELIIDNFLPPEDVTKAGKENQKGKISTGSIKGFLNLANLEAKLTGGDKKLKLAKALNELLSNDNAPVIVTGHSLGGNQTQVVAAYLDWQFGDRTNVIFQPFAPPTPGDSDFASMKVFSNGKFWYNTFDMVPYAYIMMKEKGDLDILGLEWARENLWENYTFRDSDQTGPPLPSPIFEAIKYLKGFIPRKFSRPEKETLCELTGFLPTQQTMREFLDGMGLGLDWYGSIAQLLWQHFPPCYRDLLWSQYKEKIVYFDYKSFKPLYT